MEGDFNERSQQVADRLLQATYGLWNALLTVNGILLAAFSAVYTMAPKVGAYITLTLIGSCALSLILLVYNFVVTKVTYYRVGQVLSDEQSTLLAADRGRDIAVAVFRHRLIQASEWVCLLLLLVEVGLVLATVLAGY